MTFHRAFFLSVLIGAFAAWALPFAFAADAPLSFDQALEKIMERSTRIGVQEQSYLSLKAANVPTKLFWLPTITADAKNSNSGYAGAPFTQRVQQAELVAGLNLFRFGADYELMRAARNDVSQQQSLLGAVVLQTEDQGVRALVSSIQRKLEVDVYRRQVQIREETLTIARERFNRGLLAQQEVQKVLIDAENARARMVEGQLQSIEADAALKDLLGTAEVEVRWPWQEKFLNGKIGEFVAARTLDVAERPDWAAAQFRLTAEENRTSRNWRLLLPAFDASFTYGTYRYAPASSIPNGPAWQGILSVSIPLFDRLTNLSNARAESFLARQAEIQRVEVERQAESQFEAAKSSLLRSVHSAAEREATLAKSKGLYQDSFRRFQSGRSDTNEVLIDQNRVLDSEFLAITGWSEAHNALARFCHELGKRLRECMQAPVAGDSPPRP